MARGGGGKSSHGRGGGSSSRGRGGRGSSSGRGGRGRARGLANQGARAGDWRHYDNNKKNVNSRNRHKVVVMRRDTNIREQPFEYVVIVHAEHAVPCPMKQVEEAQKQEEITTAEKLKQEQEKKEQQNSNSNSNKKGENQQQQEEEEEEEEEKFDPKQIVQLGICVLHTPSGTCCGKLQAYIRPPNNTLPLSQYCCNVLGVDDFQRDVIDKALPLVDVLETAEKWVKTIIRTGGDGGESVFEIKRTIVDDSENDEEEEDEEGDDEEQDEEEQQHEEEDSSNNKNKKDTKSETTTMKLDDEEEQQTERDPSSHTIVLASDGVPTISSIFHGNQQYSPSLLHPRESDQILSEGEDQQQQQQQKRKSRFSYLNTLSAAIFDRYLDVRDSFHRYFRVPRTTRLKLHEMLKEIGLNFQGRPRCAVDVAFNISRLMVACMKKGCVYNFPLLSRASHEQEKIFADVGSSLRLGDNNSNNATGATTTAAASSNSESGGRSTTGRGGGNTQNDISGGLFSAGRSTQQGGNLYHQNEKKNTHQMATSLLANRADVALLHQDVQVATNASSSPFASSSSSSSFFTNEVFVRWVLCFVLVLGIFWNLHGVKNRNNNIA